jgi:hypothetical protein
MLLLLLLFLVGQADGSTPLFVASQNGHVDVVRALLQAGAGAVVNQVAVRHYVCTVKVED